MSALAAIVLGNLINEYRNAWQQTPEDRTIGNPIYRVPIPQTY